MNYLFSNNAGTEVHHVNNDAKSGRYILEGIFAELGVMNVNHRIYTEDEYLKHLTYLRDDIKKGEPLLGELDHPEDRFEVKLHEASHRILDLWYDADNKRVMGKIELLDTPNGKLAKSLVDYGVPLHISSRAAGTVNKNNTVSIQQIYTYDLVAKPGFAKAVLHRVNESKNSYNDTILGFLQKVEDNEKHNVALLYGINEGCYAGVVNSAIRLRKEAINIQKNNTKIDIMKLTNHINEEAITDGEIQEDKSAESAKNAGVPVVDTSLYSDGDFKDEKDDKKSNDSEKDKKDDKDDEDDYKIIKIEAVTDEESDEDDSDDSDEDEEDKKEDSDEDSDKKDKDKKKDSDEDSDKKDKDKKEDSDEDNKTDESKGSCGKKDKTDDCNAKSDKKEIKSTEKNQLFDKAKEVNNKRDKFNKSFEDLVENLKKKKTVNESIKNELSISYPFTMYMTESNMLEFHKLSDKQKRKVSNYLMENAAYDAVSINNIWRNGLSSVKIEEPVWLKYASSDDRKLYESCTDEEKNNLQETAKYFIFENKSDVNSFWLNSGLRDKSERTMIFESYVNTIPKIAVSKTNNELPYSQDEINLIGDIACEYNRKW
jgi:hypothetical protein